MLRSQLLWRLLPSVLVVILVASVFAYRLSLDMATDAYDAALFDSARSLAQQIEISGGARPSLALPRAAEEILLFDPHDRIYYRVAAADGSTVAGDERLPMPPMQLTGELPVRFYDTHVGGEKVRASAYALFTQGEHPAGTVIFAETMVKRRHLLERILVTLVLPLVIITVLAAALVWYGVRSGLAPLNDLASALARRGSSDLRPVATDRVPGEVRPAVEAFNNLMTRVEAAQSAQQRFLSEAAHQLRTPLAGLSAQLDRALRAQDYEALKPALDQLRGASRRVTRLVNQLLTIARAEPGADPSRVHRVRPCRAGAGDLPRVGARCARRRCRPRLRRRSGTGARARPRGFRRRDIEQPDRQRAALWRAGRAGSHGAPDVRSSAGVERGGRGPRRPGGGKDPHLREIPSRGG